MSTRLHCVDIINVFRLDRHGFIEDWHNIVRRVALQGAPQNLGCTRYPEGLSRIIWGNSKDKIQGLEIRELEIRELERRKEKGRIKPFDSAQPIRKTLSVPGFVF